MITPSRDRASQPPIPRAASGASRISPYYQLLLGRLRSDAWGDGPLQAVGLTSSTRGEGVSTVAARLATAAAAQLNVALVEINWSHPSFAGRLGVPHAPGLADVLLGRCPLNEALHPTAEAAGFCVVPWGQPHLDLAAPRSVSAFAEVLRRLRQQFDLLLFDLPPARPAEPSLQWTGLLDGMLLVIEAGRVHEEDARLASKTLADARARLLGAVLNKHRNDLPRWMQRRS